ncbi:glycosyltransferase family 4 protein [Candidatus Margulisiibacteriota bacterium]
MKRKKLRIAQIAPITERVPPKMYGGTERAIHYLTEGLIDRGHQVTLFASGDSITKGRLISVNDRGTRLDKNVRDPYALTILLLTLAFEQMASEFDIIHSHLEYFSLPYTRMTKVPTVFSMHGRLDLPEYKKLLNHYNKQMFVSISNSQRKPMKDINWAQTIYHGYPETLFSFNEQPQDYFLYLGRIAEEKYPNLAIELAKKANINLKIAAKIDPTDQIYFKEKIEPLLDHPNIEFIGEVNDLQKTELLSNAKALLNTINWPEPFGLVMIEALACGTPVITGYCGSTPEIITPGKTGFLCVSEEDYLNAIQMIDTIDRKACRKEFEARFTQDIMVDNYERLYYKAIN